MEAIPIKQLIPIETPIEIKETKEEKLEIKLEKIEAEINKENNGTASTNEQISNSKKVDYEKRYLDYIKQLAEKKSKEQQETEDERKRMIESRNKLKKIILARAEKLKQLKEIEQSTQNNNKEQQETEEQKTPNVEGDDKKKLLEKGKLRKYFRSRYASLLSTLAEAAKAKKLEEEKKKKHQEEIHQKIKSKLGVDQVQSKFMQPLTKPMSATEINNSAQKPIQKPIGNTIISNSPQIQENNSVAAVEVVKIAEKPKEEQNEKSSDNTNTVFENKDAAKSVKTVDESKSCIQELEPIKEFTNESKRPFASTTTFKADGSIMHKNLHTGKTIEEEKIDPEEKKKLAKEAAERILQRQQQYLQQMQERKQMKEKGKEEEKAKKERALKKLVEKAKTEIHELHENYKRQESVPKVPAKTQKKFTPHEVEKITENFLERNKSIKKAEINITDLAVWKKKNKIPEDTKVFNVTGGYGDIIKALKHRGWVENKKYSSLCFDFKWTIGTGEIDYTQLEDFQMVNHYEKNGVITTKVGLCHHLRDLIWYNNVDVDTFYPRCFDLVDPGDTEDFMEEFKNVKAESILKEFALSGGKIESVGEEKLLVALNICERRLKDLDDILDDHKAEITLVSPEEWEVLGSDEITPEELSKKKHGEWYKRILKKYNRPKKKKSKKSKKNAMKSSQENPQTSTTIAEPEPDMAAANKELLTKVNETLAELKKRFPQFNLNGYHNIWIVKPAGSSRGRGIKIFNNLTEIIDYGKCREQQYIVQKYMENPMIIKCRKFDIRQWVLVSNFCPLTIWFYEECYIRFGAVEYKISEITNKFMHLTNNSVTKHYEGEGGEIEGNMWEQADFENYLKVFSGSAYFPNRKLSKMMYSKKKFNP